MEPNQATRTKPLDLLDVLGAVRSWPLEQVLALTRELACALPPEGRTAMAREALGMPRDAAPADRPAKGNIAELIGIIPYDGPPLTDEDVDRLREERLWKKYGPW